MHTVKLVIDCGAVDDPLWGSTTTHEVRNLSYEALVKFQRELFEALGSVILSHGEAKVTTTETVKPNTFTR
jgi:hypothetical protein